MANANKEYINEFRRKVFGKVMHITKLMSDVMELDDNYSDKFKTDFFNNYLPIGDEYPFEKDWREQVTDLIAWGDKIIDLMNEQ